MVHDGSIFEAKSYATQIITPFKVTLHVQVPKCDQNATSQAVLGPRRRRLRDSLSPWSASTTDVASKLERDDPSATDAARQPGSNAHKRHDASDVFRGVEGATWAFLRFVEICSRLLDEEAEYPPFVGRRFFPQARC
jgi:hypothetical protein